MPNITFVSRVKIDSSSDATPSYVPVPMLSGTCLAMMVHGSTRIARVVFDGNVTLQPGETETANIAAMLLASDLDEMTAGARFELRNGPFNRWGECEIIEISRIDSD